MTCHGWLTDNVSLNYKICLCASSPINFCGSTSFEVLLP